MKRILLLCIFFACIDVGDSAHAACIVNSGTPSYPDGTYLSAEICNANGAVKTSGGAGGTQYAEDAVHASGDTGTMALGVRKDTAASLAGTDGDYTAPIFDSTNRLWVSTEMPDAAALADNTANPTVPGVAAFIMCYDGATWDRCQGGLSDTDDDSIAFSQVPTLTIAIPYVSNGTNHERQRKFVYIEDAAETAGAGLAMAGSVRRDTAASSAGTTGDNATINTDGLGRLWTREGNPCADYARITSASISESTAARNEIVALSASNLIYVCSYKWVTTAANSLSWSYGTGTDCATGTTEIEGAQPYAANGGVAESGGGFPLFVVPAGNALCLLSSAATAHGGRVSYVKTAAP